MGTQYTAVVNATSNTSAATDDTFIEIFPPSGVAVQLKRIRVSVAHLTALDLYIRVKVNRASAAGATGTAYTPKKRRPGGPASVATCNVKNGTTAFTQGTVVDTMIDVVFNGRGLFEWVARDDNDFITSGVNERLAVVCRSGTASTILNVEADWEE